MSKPLYLIAQFELNKADEFADTFAEHARASKDKPGCRFFYLIRDRENPAKFATMECWDTYAHFEQHVADDEHTEFHGKIKQYWKEEPVVMEGDLVR
ncbi:quinol monooxygenase YgiN [Lewinella aquimaris]|uniref:Quinol monooxygenase YgiN n=1 Tax=Neolewinella aquimaris TaxID=1835722 RepID=A0A840E9H0_9BACT|nr:antibiotic biosynthesis monooxygenase family protein [Neolewinella aquimaris]MBB4077686.1 quinol monooxygenase YgiN [Neolewinella aquimaris]